MFPDGAAPATILCCKRATAREANRRQLAMLPGGDDNPVFQFRGVDMKKGAGGYCRSCREDDGGDGPMVYDDRISNAQPIYNTVVSEPLLPLRVGAKVVCISNLDKKAGVVNGTVGTVVGFKVASSVRGNESVGYDMSPELADKDFPMIHSELRWPKVRFDVPCGPGVTMPVLRYVMPVVFGLEDSRGEEICSRVQIPLLLQYAFSPLCFLSLVVMF